MVEFSEQGPPVQSERIDALERVLRSSLPDAYRAFLLRANGGRPGLDVVDVDGAPGSPTDVQIFFGIDRAVESSCLEWNLRLVRERCLREDLLPIACDSGGNLFCLALGKEHDAAIVYLDLDSPDCPIHPVAASFTGFLVKLRAWTH